MVLLDGAGKPACSFADYPTFTLADIVLGLSTRRWYLTSFPYPDRPAIARFYQTLCQSPGFEFDGNNGAP